MGIHVAFVLFTVASVLLPLDCVVLSEFQFPPKWDRTVQQCLDGLARELPPCGDYILDRHSKSQLRTAAQRGNDGLKAIVRKLCISYEMTGRVCLDGYLKWVAPCMNETQLHQEQNLVHMAHASWRDLCSDDGIHSVGLFSKSTVQCVQHRSFGLLRCLRLLRLRSFKDMMDAMVQLLVVGECTTFNDTAVCILDELRQCTDQSAANIMEGELAELAKRSPCRSRSPSNQRNLNRRPPVKISLEPHNHSYKDNIYVVNMQQDLDEDQNNLQESHVNDIHGKYPILKEYDFTDSKYYETTTQAPELPMQTSSNELHMAATEKPLNANFEQHSQPYSDFNPSPELSEIVNDISTPKISPVTAHNTTALFSQFKIMPNSKTHQATGELQNQLTIAETADETTEQHIVSQREEINNVNDCNCSSKVLLQMKASLDRLVTANSMHGQFNALDMASSSPNITANGTK